MKKLWCVAMIIVGMTLTTFGADFSGWAHYRTISITPPTALTAAVANFPLLVTLNRTPNHDDSLIISQAQSPLTGLDIRFASNDGSNTALSYQRVSWDTGAKTAEFWVLVPGIAASGATTIKMYWGKTGAIAPDVSSPAAVFSTSNNFRAVWHMNGAAGVNDTDATGTGHDAVPSGSPANVAGGTGVGKGFDGATQYFTVNHSADSGSSLIFPVGGPFTISAWINPQTLQTCKAILGKIYTNSCTTWSGSYGLAFYGTGAGMVRGNDINGTSAERSQYQLTADTWVHLAWVRNGAGSDLTNTNLYINGTASGQTTANNATNQRNDSLGFCIGKDADISGGTASYWTGQIDEVEVSGGVRSADWITLSYLSQQPAQTLLTNGAIVSLLAAPVLTSPANAAISQPLIDTLRWSAVSGALSYGVQVSIDSAFGTFILNDTAVVDSSRVVSGLSANVTYYWRVNARSAAGPGLWSSLSKFMTTTAGVRHNDVVYKYGKMGRTGILAVYSSDGRRVLSVPFTASATKSSLLKSSSKSLAKGLYLYRITGAENSVIDEGSLSVK